MAIGLGDIHLEKKEHHKIEYNQVNVKDIIKDVERQNKIKEQ